MPVSKVTVTATFAKIVTTNPFTDIAEGTYYYDAVLWAVENDVTEDTTATAFSPAASCTRAQTVTFLWRAAGSYYAKAVQWAVEQGITLGTSDTTFSPDVTVTRAQVVTFLYRAGESNDVDHSQSVQ